MAVSAAGTIKGLRRGSAWVTVATHNGYSARVLVKVVKAPSSVKLSRTKLSLALGEGFRLTAKLSSGASSKLTFITSNAGVADIDADGTVTALFEGTATITVKTNTGKKAACKVTVVYRSRPESIALSETGTVLLPFGAKLDLGAGLQMLPEGTNSGIKWTSSNKKIATVDKYGNVKFKKAGKVTITATATRGKKKARVRFTVSK